MSHGEGAANKSNEYFNRYVEHEGEDDYADRWTTDELLYLSSTVKHGDRNWVSVARLMKPYVGDLSRPPEWYTPKNCAFQYNRLLNEVDEESKKKPRMEREVSENTLLKSLTAKRLNELACLSRQIKSVSSTLKGYIEMAENGDYDDNLDDILKQLEEQERQQEESYNEYVIMREKLIESRKLNISRIKRGKANSKPADTKKKISLSDPPESNPHHAVVEEVIKSIKKEMKSSEEFASPTKVTTPVKSEVVSPAKMMTPIKSEMEAITLNALLDSKVTIPSSVAPTSPLLTSLLRSIASPSSGSHPLSASSSSSLKEISPKAVSSPQPFFNPTSALATAAAQQLAVATSTIPLFQQHELADGRKISLSSSPITSACLSAPTLSKLLEMPPSTPGRLPPLPVLDPPSTPVPTTPVAISVQTTPSPAVSPQKLSLIIPSEVLKTPIEESPSKKAIQVPIVSSAGILDESSIQLQPLQEVPADVQEAVMVSAAVEEVPEISTEALESMFDETQLENIDILERVCESINQAFEDKVIKKEVKEEEPSHAEPMEQDDVIKNICPPKSLIEASSGPVSLSIGDADKLPLMPLTPKLKTSPTLVKSEQFSSTTPVSIQDAKAGEVNEDDKGGSGKKFYKSRTGIKKEEILEKTPDSTSLLQSPKKAVQIKTESKSPVDAMEIPVVIEEPEAKQLEAKAIKVSSETKSPPAKKPRLYEKTPTEKPQELSEDEAVVRRSGRRGKKGRGRSAKSNLAKMAEPKDQYEFTESTEENSVGYQATNTLCYMPRLKEDSRADEPKAKSSAQEFEDTPNVSMAEKKSPVSLRNKQGRQPSNQQSARKLFPCDEERLSDSLTSDEASNHLLSEDKLKKWEETCEKKGDSAKGVGEGVKRTWKGIEIAKKKIQPPKKGSSTKPGKKDRKPSSVDMEDLSTGSRDSEEISGTDKEISDEKDLNTATPMDMEVETNDSHPCSSVAAESDKQMEDVEGGESFQGSVTTDFSPPPDVKEAPHFGKQDWMHNSPKSSEAVSQSSEESEYESDNWDNQSVSTNKSASQSTGTHPRLKRKERETPEYKAWKKAISIVLREVSCHKNANVFLQKVTNDVAPGYLSIVHQPMDLSLIKKNIDNGVVKTTSDFHRDMLLMFQNAIMYNSSDHDVHQMAVEMQKDVIEQIGAFLITQHNSKNAASEPVTNLRGARTAKAQKGKQSASSSKLKEEAD